MRKKIIRVFSLIFVFLFAINFRYIKSITNYKSNLFENPKQIIFENSISVKLKKSGYTPVNLRAGFCFLDDSSKIIYSNLEDNIFNISEKKYKNGKYVLSKMFFPMEVNLNDIKKVLIAFDNDRPDVFWLSKSYIVSQLSNGVEIIFFSEMSIKQILKYKIKLEKSISDFFEGIPSNLSQYDLELWIHDKLIKFIKYAPKTSDIEKELANYNIVGALINQCCVCEGYAKATKLLFNLVGIVCETVVGYGRSELHMWNFVYINGGWYHLDITWDRTTNGSANSHNYFNLTYPMISFDHNLDFTKNAKNPDEFKELENFTKFNNFLGVKDAKSTKENFLDKNSYSFSICKSNVENTNECYGKISDNFEKKRYFSHIKFKNMEELKKNFKVALNISLNCAKKVAENKKINILNSIHFFIVNSHNVVNLIFETCC